MHVRWDLTEIPNRLTSNPVEVSHYNVPTRDVERLCFGSGDSLIRYLEKDFTRNIIKNIRGQ